MWFTEALKPGLLGRVGPDGAIQEVTVARLGPRDCGHRRRTGRQPLVHGALDARDRAHDARRARWSAGARCRTVRPTSSLESTATCGSPSRTTACWAASRRPGRSAEVRGGSSSAKPHGIVTGPDGALWWSEQTSTGWIVRADPRTGAVKSYALPTAGRPTDLAPGPDGAVWFTAPTARRSSGAPAGGIRSRAASPPTAKSPSTPRRPAWCRSRSPRAPTARCGSPFPAAPSSGVWTPAAASRPCPSPPAAPPSTSPPAPAARSGTPAPGPDRIGRVSLIAPAGPRPGLAPLGPEAPGPAIAATPAPAAAAVADLGRPSWSPPSKGTVKVRTPGSERYVSLTAAGGEVPVGSLVDTRKGTVALRTAVDARGATQDGAFRGAIFQVRQARKGNGMTELVLKGGSFAGCRGLAPTAGAGAASARQSAGRSAACGAATRAAGSAPAGATASRRCAAPAGGRRTAATGRSTELRRARSPSATGPRAAPSSSGRGTRTSPVMRADGPAAAAAPRSGCCSRSASASRRAHRDARRRPASARGGHGQPALRPAGAAVAQGTWSSSGWTTRPSASWASSGPSRGPCMRARSTRCAAGARRIVYDVQFTEPTVPREDNALIRAVGRAPRRRAGDERDRRARRQRRARRRRRAAPASARGRPPRTCGRQPAATRSGCRRSWGGLTSLGVAGAAGLGPAADPRGFRGGEALDRLPRRPGHHPRVLVLRRGPAAASIPPGSAARSSSWARCPDAAGPPPDPDQHDEPMGGPEVQANAIWTAMHGFPLRDAPGWLGIVLVLGLATLPALACRRGGAVGRCARRARGRRRVRRRRPGRLRPRDGPGRRPAADRPRGRDPRRLPGRLRRRAAAPPRGHSGQRPPGGGGPTRTRELQRRSSKWSGGSARPRSPATARPAPTSSA